MEVTHRCYGGKERVYILCAPMFNNKKVPQTKEWDKVTCKQCLELKIKLRLK